MKESYARKQRNQAFVQLGKGQVLTDLNLLKDGLLNYAALILIGKKSAIETYLPQSKTIW
jgi:ATP-dependent DNA helicase RecG